MAKCSPWWPAVTVHPLRPKQHTTAHQQEVASYRGVANPAQAAAQAFFDVDQLRWEVREMDPREVWGRLRLLPWDRVQAALIVALAAIPADAPLGELVAWTDPYASREDIRA